MDTITTISNHSSVPDIQETFGLRVRELRLAKGVSQEELADKAGLDRTYISSVERGKRNVSIVNIQRLAKALGAKPHQLLQSEKIGKS